MRLWRPTLLLTTAALVLWASPASAEPPAAPAAPLGAAATAPFFMPRANVASLSPVTLLPVLPRWGRSYDGSSRRPLRITGTVVLSLGLATLLGAGLSGIVAAASAANLSSYCPNYTCVEGSIGPDRVRDARDAARATDWLIGIGGPVVASGTVMLIYSAVLERYASVQPTTVFQAQAGPTGASMTIQF